jgi:hypothetical protein
VTDTPTIERAAEMPQDPDLDRVTEPDTTLTVVQALNRVMLDVTVLRKGREQRSEAGSFRFRGIDDVMNAVGPSFRRHGVVCLPNVLDVGVEHATTAKGKAMTVTRVQVEYTFYGPAGDSITCRTPGEAFDSGDKSTAKAMSVAYRTALLQALTLPTDEPDPDETVEELAPRQQLPASRPAQRQRAGQQQDDDPWQVRPLTEAGKDLVAQAIAADDDRTLTSLLTKARGMAEQHVTPQFLGPCAPVLHIEGPFTLVQLVERVQQFVQHHSRSAVDYVDAATQAADGTGGAAQ